MDTGDYGKREWLREVISDFYCFVVVMTICIGFILCCTGCASAKPVVTERTLHDTTYVERTRVDSVLQRDSIWLEVQTKGDTVYKTKHVDRWRDRVSIRHDTVYATRTDSTSAPPVRERKASKWEQSLMTIGKFAVHIGLTAVAIIVIGLIWLRHRKV